MKKTAIAMFIIIVLAASIAEAKIVGNTTKKSTPNIMGINQKPESNRLMIFSVDKFQRRNIEKNGCKILRDFGNTVSASCPLGVYISNSRPERRYSVMQNAGIKGILENDLIRASKVWEQGYTGKNRTVAILDTGVDYYHENLETCDPISYSFMCSDSGEPRLCNFNDFSTIAVESPHPYPDFFEQTWVIEEPGFTSISVHFANISVENFFDFIEIKDQNNMTVEFITGARRNFWTTPVNGSVIYVTLVSDFSINDYGFYIDAVANITALNTSLSWSSCSKIVAGKDFANFDDDPFDDIGHGTAIAGIVSGKGIETNNPLSSFSKGVAPDSKLMIAKVCSFFGCWESDIAAGLDWASMGPDGVEKSGDEPDVISMSLGSVEIWYFTNCDKDFLSKKINEVVLKKKIPVVVAAGNNIFGPPGVSSPACASRAIAAGSSNFNFLGGEMNERVSWFSARGFAMRHHGIVAPGEFVLSTAPGNQYDFLSGTSASAPQVAGVIALMKEKNPKTPLHSLRNAIFGTAVDIGFGSFEQGKGRLDAFSAVKRIRPARP